MKLISRKLEAYGDRITYEVEESELVKRPYPIAVRDEKGNYRYDERGRIQVRYEDRDAVRTSLEWQVPKYEFVDRGEDGKITVTLYFSIGD